MFYKNWEPIYKKILKDFNFKEQEDIKVAELLDEILKTKKIFSIKKLEPLLQNREVFIFGAGPSLKKMILKHKNKFLNKIKIAADGATTALLEENIYPEIIVTDLDGNIKDQIRANTQKSLVIIHAHGDNLQTIKKHVIKFTGDIIGTTQTDPAFFRLVYNFGGFTDGDRAVFIAEHFRAKKIKLIGYDYKDEIGKYSFTDKKNKKIKLKKLKWCKKLIGDLEKENQNIEYLKN
jgi:hypothetical protein